MTDPGGFSDAILLRMVDRLVLLEQEAATSSATIKSVSMDLNGLHASVAELSAEMEKLRAISSSTRQSFEQMRMPLQRLLDLRAKFSGAWLVVTAIFVAFAYLFQPLLSEIYRWRMRDLP